MIHHSCKQQNGSSFQKLLLCQDSAKRLFSFNSCCSIAISKTICLMIQNVFKKITDTLMPTLNSSFLHNIKCRRKTNFVFSRILKEYVRTKGEKINEALDKLRDENRFLFLGGVFAFHQYFLLLFSFMLERKTVTTAVISLGIE